MKYITAVGMVLFFMLFYMQKANNHALAQQYTQTLKEYKGTLKQDAINMRQYNNLLIKYITHLKTCK